MIDGNTTSRRDSPTASTIAIDAFLLDYELPDARREPTDAERVLIRDAIIMFITNEQWLKPDANCEALAQRLRAATADRTIKGGHIALVNEAADAITDLSTRLSARTQSYDTMYDELILQAEALKRARLSAARLIQVRPEHHNRRSDDADSDGGP